MKFVIDTSPLVALSGIGRLDLLRLVCGRVAVPNAVRTEVVDNGIGWIEARDAQIAIRDGAWLATVPVTWSETFLKLRAKLGAGESECLEFARLSGAVAIIDDLKARREGVRLGVSVCGTLGMLARSKREGHVAAVAPLIAAIRRNGIHLSDVLIDKFLSKLGEGP